MGEQEETFSNPSATAWPVGFKGIPCMLEQLPLRLMRLMRTRGLYMHFTAVPVS